MSRYSKDRGARSVSIGAVIASNSPLENAGTSPANLGKATGAGDEFLYIPGPGQSFQYPPNLSWDVVVGAAMTALTVLLEGSDDGVNWQTVDTNTSTSSSARAVANPGFRMYRANITVYTPTAGTPQITVGISI